MTRHSFVGFFFFLADFNTRESKQPKKLHALCNGVLISILQSYRLLIGHIHSVTSSVICNKSRDIYVSVGMEPSFLYTSSFFCMDLSPHIIFCFFTLDAWVSPRR